MSDLIIIAGAPGSGKSTLGHYLKAALEGVYVDYGNLRKFHMDPLWAKKGDEEEALTFENLLFVVRNYLDHGWKPVIVSDIPFFRTRELVDTFAPLAQVITLLVDNDELRERIEKRTEGWKDLDRILEWNNAVRESSPEANEVRVDTTGLTPEEALKKVLNALQPDSRLRGEDKK